MTCVKSQYLAVYGLPYSSFPLILVSQYPPLHCYTADFFIAVSCLAVSASPLFSNLRHDHPRMRAFSYR